jgi:hypothetical protein
VASHGCALRLGHLVLTTRSVDNMNCPQKSGVATDLYSRRALRCLHAKNRESIAYCRGVRFPGWYHQYGEEPRRKSLSLILQPPCRMAIHYKGRNQSEDLACHTTPGLEPIGFGPVSAPRSSLAIAYLLSSLEG